MACVARWVMIFGVALSGLSGCASSPPAASPPAPVVDHSQTSATPPEAVAKATEPAPLTPLPAATAAPPAPPNPAVVALLNQADAQGRGGHLDQAATTLERALRIQPDNGWLWHRLAAVRWQQKRYGETVELAAKSSTLAHGDEKLIQANDDLISKAKTALAAQQGRG